ncbi:MAG: hypothetical protein ACRDAM_20155, partial [Casimicrobium sp.]
TNNSVESVQSWQGARRVVAYHDAKAKIVTVDTDPNALYGKALIAAAEAAEAAQAAVVTQATTLVGANVPATSDESVAETPPQATAYDTFNVITVINYDDVAATIAGTEQLAMFERQNASIEFDFGDRNVEKVTQIKRGKSKRDREKKETRAKILPATGTRDA